MAIEAALYAYLTSKTTVTDIVSTRIWPIASPQKGAYPNITYQTISDMPKYCMHGEAGVWMARIQLNLYEGRSSAGTGGLYDDLKTLQEAIRNVSSGFRGTWGSVYVMRCAITSFSDLPAVPQSGEEHNIQAVTCDLEINYVKSTPSDL